MLTADITAGSTGLDQSPRMRRLRADHERMKELASRSDLISFEARVPHQNLPPETYIVTYNCKGILDVDRQGNPKFGNRHQVEIYLHNQYPQRWPGMKWLTPIWHPNINHLNGSVCASTLRGGPPAVLSTVWLSCWARCSSIRTSMTTPPNLPSPGTLKRRAGRGNIGKVTRRHSRWTSVNFCVPNG